MPETKDLILKQAAFEDWRDMYRNIWSREESARYMLWDVTTSEEEARSRMERTMAFQKKHPYCWTVYERKSGQAIGFAGMQPRPDGSFEESGIALGPAFVGQGYGRQLLNLLTDIAFRELGAVRFISACRSGNAASRGMILGCGFTYTHSEECVDPRNGRGYRLEYYEKQP